MGDLQQTQPVLKWYQQVTHCLQLSTGGSRNCYYDRWEAVTGGALEHEGETQKRLSFGDQEAAKL